MKTTKSIVFAAVCFSLCSFAGNPLQALQEKLRALKKSYSEAAAELSRADDALAEAGRGVVKAVKDVEQTASKIVDEEKIAKTAVKWKRMAQTELRDFAASVRKTADRIANDEKLVQDFKKAKDDLEDKIREKGAQLRKMRSELMAQEVLAYSFHTEANLSFNFRTGSFSGFVDFGNGLNLDTEKIQAFIEGGYSIPRTNPVQFAASSASLQQVEHQLDYAGARKEYLSGHPLLSRYFSSERFVNWASSETAAHHVALGVVTAGSSVEDSLREVRDQIYLEFNDVVTFLSQKGEKDLPKLATCVLGQMLGIQCDASVRVKAHRDAISCELNPRGNGANDLFRKIAMPQTISLPPIPNSGKHLAFGFAIESPEGVDPKRLVEALSKQEPLEVNLEELFQHAVEGLLPQASGKALDVLKGLDFRKVADRFRVSDKVRKWVEELGLNSNDILSRYEPGNGIVDLRDTAASRKLAEFTKKSFAQGNKRDATVQVFEVDLGSSTLNMKIDILHRQSWGTVREALNEIGKAGEKVGAFAKDQQEQTTQGAQDAIAKLEQELGSLDEQVLRAVGQIAKVEKRIAGLVSALEDQEARLHKMESNARKLIDSVGSGSEQLSKLKENLDVSRKLLKERRAFRAAADQFREGAMNRVKVIEDQIDRVKNQIKRLGSVAEKEVQKAIDEIAKRIPRLPKKW